MYHLLGLWISDFFFFFNTIMRAAELHSFSPVLSLKRNGCLENVLYWRTKKRGRCCCCVVFYMIFPVIMLVCSDELYVLNKRLQNSAKCSCCRDLFCQQNNWGSLLYNRKQPCSWLPTVCVPPFCFFCVCCTFQSLKGADKQGGKDSSCCLIVMGQGLMSFSLKRGKLIYILGRNSLFRQW